MLERQAWRTQMGRLVSLVLLMLLAYPVPAQEASEPVHQIEPPLLLNHKNPLSRGTLSPSDIFAGARSGVVVIFATDQSGQREVLGSGFVVKKDRIATNHHVLEGMNKAFVVFSDGDIKNVS